MTRQPPKGGKDDYDSENFWISRGLPNSSSRRKRNGEGRGQKGDWREKWSAIEGDVRVDGAKEIKVDINLDLAFCAVDSKVACMAMNAAPRISPRVSVNAPKPGKASVVIFGDSEGLPTPPSSPVPRPFIISLRTRPLEVDKPARPC